MRLLSSLSLLHFKLVSVVPSLIVSLNYLITHIFTALIKASFTYQITHECAALAHGLPHYTDDITVHI